MYIDKDLGQLQRIIMQDSEMSSYFKDASHPACKVVQTTLGIGYAPSHASFLLVHDIRLCCF